MHRKKGFISTELLAVTAIISRLTTGLTLVLNQARKQARTTGYQGQFGPRALLSAMYPNDTNGYFPARPLGAKSDAQLTARIVFCCRAG
jgi:hypothetical protein